MQTSGILINHYIAVPDIGRSLKSGMLRNSTRSNVYFNLVSLFQIGTKHSEFLHTIDW